VGEIPDQSEDVHVFWFWVRWSVFEGCLLGWFLGGSVVQWCGQLGKWAVSCSRGSPTTQSVRPRVSPSSAPAVDTPNGNRACVSPSDWPSSPKPSSFMAARLVVKRPDNWNEGCLYRDLPIGGATYGQKIVGCHHWGEESPTCTRGPWRWGEEFAGTPVSPPERLWSSSPRGAGNFAWRYSSMVAFLKASACV
jgi:hypothetical protein